MRVTELWGRGYRNLAPFSVAPAPGLNLFLGENGHGKTNLLEALWLFTGARSFRGARDPELICWGEEAARLGLGFFGKGRGQEAELRLGGGRECRLGGVPLGKSRAKLAGEFTAVVFSPDHLLLVREGPALRRAFLDGAIGQLWPRYIYALARYNRALAQRNSLLRRIGAGFARENELDDWEMQLARQGAQVVLSRERYLSQLAPAAGAAYREISGGRETLRCAYKPGAPLLPSGDAQTLEAALLAALTEGRAQDLRVGSTCTGPHRDELALFLDERPAKTAASQGQQRSIVLALKLAEAELSQALIGEAPVILLDDVLSELDELRRAQLLVALGERQTFITGCEKEPALLGKGARQFTLSRGVVSEGS